MSELSTEARELELWGTNDYGTYKFLEAVEKNQARHFVRGNWNLLDSARGFLHAVDTAAKSYTKEFGGVWHQVFPIAARRELAQEWAEEFGRAAETNWGDLTDDARAVFEAEEQKGE